MKNLKKENKKADPLAMAGTRIRRRSTGRFYDRFGSIITPVINIIPHSNGKILPACHNFI